MGLRRFSAAHLFGIGASAEAGTEEDDKKKPEEEAGSKKPDDEAGGEKPSEEAQGDPDKAAKEEAAKVQAAAVAAARVEGATAERERIGDILASDEAKGRGDAALHLALNTDMAAGDVRKLLGTMPKQSAKGGDLGRLMAEHAPNPQIGTGGKPAEGEAGEADRLAASILAAGRLARGEKA